MSSPLNGAEGLIGNSGRNTADACDANTRETNAATTPHLIFFAVTIFMEVQTPFPS
jgi:hypothetical protein